MNGGSFVVAEKAASVDGHKRGKTERGEEEGRKKKEGRRQGRRQRRREEGKKYRTESSVSHFSHCAQ